MSDDIFPDIEEYTFEDFWGDYDKKRGKASAMSLWSKLKKEEKQLIAVHVPVYVASTPKKQYRKDPPVYLRNRCWEDEIIVEEKDEPYVPMYKTINVVPRDEPPKNIADDKTVAKWIKKIREDISKVGKEYKAEADFSELDRKWTRFKDYEQIYLPEQMEILLKKLEDYPDRYIRQINYLRKKLG